ncbi:hypothetical protein Glove_66g184 [Diversispora epigaea]|uniref:Zn-finger domain-containing protein n=1 Tax=Diversispora epigaea TaxID=1348612 RepID=A0A397JAH2_9GLOM|nr:hypothetical protein Glove_66g184 [Diversispora epigaea]
MSRNFKCTFCENYYSTFNGLSQYLKRCKQTFYSSTEESNEEVLEIISDINDMSLDSEEFQSVLKGLPSSSKTRENPSQDLYEFEEYEEYNGDISLISQSNIIQDSEIFEEILNFEEPENPELIEEVLQSQSNEELGNSEFFEERFRSIEESEIEEPEIEINEFPNEAYADLMILVTKYNLNNEAGNAIIKFFNKHSNVSVSPLPKNIVVGRRYMDKMNSRLSYHKHSILSHNNVEYFIHYCPIVNCIENLLSNLEITKYFAYDYEDLVKSVNTSIPSVAKVLSIILYSDATTLDTLGKSSLHPIYISLGNIPIWRRNKEDVKQLLSYLPIISAKDETEKKSSEFKILAHKTFHNSIKFLLEPLFENASIDLKIDDKRIWFYPRISTVICDWPEACTFSLTYKSSNLNYPCHFCLVSKDNLINTCLRKSQAVLCNKENMKKYYDNDTTKEASLEPVYNYFWDIPDLNIYDATVPDRMHHLDLGLYHYQIEFTKELLSKSSIDKFNRRIAEIPRHPGLKIFARGLQSIARLTANEFRDLMKVMVFVVDDLHNKDLSEVYVKWNEMYLLNRLETFKESDLKIFQKAIDDWANLFIKLFQNISGLKFPKLHSWKYHIINTIRKYGAINGYITETYESLHKTYVKIPYCLSNKRDVETQIMKIRRAIILQKQMEKKYKTLVFLNYTSKLFDFKFSEASEFCEKQKNNSNLNEKMRKGFTQFFNHLKLDFSKIISTDTQIKIFGSVTLNNSTFLCATNKYYDNPWFSNIAVIMDTDELSNYQLDSGTCYAQTLLVTQIVLLNKSLHLALVQWYDFKSRNIPFVYGCPWLELVEKYNFIEIEAIEEIVHIVPQFDKKNEYFVNKYIF